MDINNVILIGRLTKDIELRYTAETNIACAMFDIAVGNGKNETGEERKADFIRIVAWRGRAENLAKYCKKGSQIAVEGRLKNDSYEDKDGNKRYRTYVLANAIEFIGTKREAEPLPTPGEEIVNQVVEEMTKQDDPFKEFGEEVIINDEDLPF